MLDSVLGEIHLHDDEITCSLHADGGAIELKIRLGGAPSERGIQAARRLKETLPSKLHRARDALVRAFLPMVNEGYLGEDEAPLTSDAFLRRAVLAGVEIDAHGNISFHFNDDDMLWGHWMTVCTNLEETSWESSMWG